MRTGKAAHELGLIPSISPSPEICALLDLPQLTDPSRALLCIWLRSDKPLGAKGAKKHVIDLEHEHVVQLAAATKR